VIDPAIRDLAHGKNFAAFTTLGPTGNPATHVMWVDADDDHVLINTELERQKTVNVMKDPRVAVMIWDAETPYKYAEVRGRVVDIVRGERARAHIDELSRKYLDHDYASPIGSERVILVIEPVRQRAR
jgi:PPOX class probable F420-dependent enzyme